MEEITGKLAQKVRTAMDEGLKMYWTFTFERGFELRAVTGVRENGKVDTRLCWSTFYFEEARKVNRRLAGYENANRRSLRQVCTEMDGARLNYWRNNKGDLGFGDR